ncbi:hypothetical protein EJB05_14602, partial [Eragrostis curvula]
MLLFVKAKSTSNVGLNGTFKVQPAKSSPYGSSPLVYLRPVGPRSLSLSKPEASDEKRTAHRPSSFKLWRDLFYSLCENTPICPECNKVGHHRSRQCKPEQNKSNPYMYRNLMTSYYVEGHEEPAEDDVVYVTTVDDSLSNWRKSNSRRDSHGTQDNNVMGSCKSHEAMREESQSEMISFLPSEITSAKAPFPLPSLVTVRVHWFMTTGGIIRCWKGFTGGAMSISPSSIFTTTPIGGLASGISCTHQNATLYILSTISFCCAATSPAAATPLPSLSSATSSMSLPSTYLVHASLGNQRWLSGAASSKFLRRPTISNSSMPKLYTSHFSVTPDCRHISGVANPGVPRGRDIVTCVAAWFTSRASPKSVTLGVSAASRRTFPGLMS